MPMDRRSEPPDWALPGWSDLEALDDEDGHGHDRSARPVASEARAPGTFGLRILGVSEVTRAVRGAIRAEPGLTDVWVEGEVGRVTVSSAGHAYFALKDARNQLGCVWFRDDRLRSAFEAQAGLRVVAHGRIDLFEPQGALQLYVDSLQPAGVGDLALRFEALKAKLADEGLFDQGRKRALPVRPRVIAVVTSPTGAVWRDICHVLARRWPLARVILVASKVQGEDAPASLVAGLGRVARWIETCERDGRPGDAPAVTIVARGGGSLEDLWAFNDERVVRAVVVHPVPVVAGIGHEVDVTLTDFAADVRAPTPSAAAELVVPDRADLLAAIAGGGRRLDAGVARRLAAAGQVLGVEQRALVHLHPASGLATSRERVGLLVDRATRAISVRMATDRARLGRHDGLAASAAGRVAVARSALVATAGALTVLGPQATLDRGYAIVRRGADGAIVRTAAEVPPGTALRIRVAHGDVAATVDGPA